MREKKGKGNAVLERVVQLGARKCTTAALGNSAGYRLGGIFSRASVASSHPIAAPGSQLPYIRE